MVTICKCSHEQHCTQPERGECPHAAPHEPMDWATNVPGELFINDKFGICNVTDITCNAGSDGTVICEVIHVFDPAPATVSASIAKITTYVSMLVIHTIQVAIVSLQNRRCKMATHKSIQDGDYVISTKGVPIKLTVTVKGDKVTYRDGNVGDIQDIRDWTFKRIEFRPPPDPESLTCFNCKNNDICKYANDPYNTNGDCLAMK